MAARAAVGETAARKSAGNARSAGSKLLSEDSMGHSSEGSVWLDRLSTAPNPEMLRKLLSSVAKRTAEAAHAASFAAAIAAKEFSWLAIMQRTFNTEDKTEQIDCHDEVVEIVCNLVDHADSPGLRTLLISCKLSSLLTASPHLLERAVRCVLKCLQQPADVDAFLRRMQGLENVQRLVESGALVHAALMVATVVGRHPGSAADIVGSDIDTTLLRRTFALMREASPDRAKIGAMVLYFLRFAARHHVNDLPFVERTLYVCAQFASTLPSQTADTAADVCQLTTSTRFVESHPNVLLNIHAAAAAWSGLPRTLPIAALLARAIPAAPRASIAQATFRAYYSASAMVHVDKTSIDGAQTLLYIVACLVRVTPPAYAAKVIRFGQLGQCADAVLGAQPPSPALVERLVTVVWTLLTKAPTVGLKGVWRPLAPMVSTGALAKAAFQRIVGQPYAVQTADALDRAAAALISSFAEQAAAVEVEHLQERQHIAQSEDAGRRALLEAFQQAGQQIDASPEQKRFNSTVIPASQFAQSCLAELELRRNAAQTAVTDKMNVSSDVIQRHRAVVAQLDEIAPLNPGAPEAEQHQVRAERCVLDLLAGFEVAAAAKRHRWKHQQMATVTGARLSAAAQTLGSATALLLLTEEIERGYGWYGVVADGATRVRSIAQQEQDAREILQLTIVAGPGVVAAIERIVAEEVAVRFEIQRSWGASCVHVAIDACQGLARDRLLRAEADARDSLETTRAQVTRAT